MGLAKVAPWARSARYAVYSTVRFLPTSEPGVTSTGLSRGVNGFVGITGQGITGRIEVDPQDSLDQL